MTGPAARTRAGGVRPTGVTGRPGVPGGPVDDDAAGADVAAVPLLRRRGFRLYLSAQLLGSSGLWMLRMAKDWLVLELTGSAAAVGLLVALQFLPLFVVGPLGGVVADRHDKRRLVLATQTSSAVVAGGLAALTLTGTIAVWHLYASAVLLGLVAAVELPARQALVGEVVGDGSLRSAISLNNALNQGGGLVGPALAGLVIAQVGQGWAFGANALVCVAVVALLGAIRPAELLRAQVVAPARGQLREGFGFVARRPALLGVVVLAGLMGALGMNGPVVLASFADGVWHTGARGFGLYNSVSAIGALAGAVLAARLKRLRVRVVVLGSALFALAEATAAVMPTEGAFVLALGAVGAATLFFLTSAATYVQLAADPAVRGRVLGIYSPVLLGGHALGALLQGWLAEELGVRLGLVVTGGLALLATAAVAAGLARVGRATPPEPDGSHDATPPDHPPDHPS
ncbi:MFS transporter [uncultured Cellulomonas sp.]|uniref:MFS transporter n=1 Tax=uncultured Cellulomonas sp. TaxID=189682 RepID=UPI0026291034|nr:MFS transporter [uncultured Cellulomonas sp.]